MSLQKDFIPYQESLEMKELGFDEPCFARYYKAEPHYSAPTFSQAFRFFRENYPDLDFAVGKIHNGTNNYHYHINLVWEFFEGTYEEAELELLRKLIQIVKEKQHEK